jgi:hypothetical protein
MQRDFIKTQKAHHVDLRKLAIAATFSIAGCPKVLPQAIVASWG